MIQKNRKDADNSAQIAGNEKEIKNLGKKRQYDIITQEQNYKNKGKDFVQNSNKRKPQTQLKQSAKNAPSQQGKLNFQGVRQPATQQHIHSSPTKNITQQVERGRQFNANTGLTQTNPQDLLAENLQLVREEANKLHQQKINEREERQKAYESKQYKSLIELLETELFKKQNLGGFWEDLDQSKLAQIFSEVKSTFESHKIHKDGNHLIQNIYLNMMQTIEDSKSQEKIERFFENNHVQIIHKKNQAANKNQKRKHKKLSKEIENAPKLLFIVGNTQLISDFLLNELKTSHNLIIQKVSMIQRRNTQTFKTSIFEGTQSTVQYQQSGGSSIFEQFFNKANASNQAKNSLSSESTTDPQNSQNTQNPSSTPQYSQKILLFEDMDIVFQDESEFYPQLIKLMQITKVPIILTASNMEKVNESFLQHLEHNLIPFNLVKYKYNRPRGCDIRAYLKMIFLYENFVSENINMQLIDMKDKDLKSRIKSHVTKNLKHIDLRISQIYKQSGRNISQLLNEMHLLIKSCDLENQSKTTTPRKSQQIFQNRNVNIDQLFSNSLTQYATDQQLEDETSILEYAKLSDSISEYSLIQERIDARCDVLQFEDQGFLQDANQKKELKTYKRPKQLLNHFDRLYNLKRNDEILTNKVKDFYNIRMEEKILELVGLIQVKKILNQSLTICHVSSFKININDPIIKSLGSRDFPVSMRENADIHDIYRSIIKQFSIKGCQTLGLGLYPAQMLHNIHNLSAYPQIEYDMQVLPLHEEEPISLDSSQEGQEKENNNIQGNKSEDNSIQTYNSNDNSMQNHLLQQKIPQKNDLTTQKSIKVRQEQQKYQQTVLTKSQFFKSSGNPNKNKKKFEQIQQVTYLLRELSVTDPLDKIYEDLHKNDSKSKFQKLDIDRLQEIISSEKIMLQNIQEQSRNQDYVKASNLRNNKQPELQKQRDIEEEKMELSYL
eukprot:403351346